MDFQEAIQTWTLTLSKAPDYFKIYLQSLPSDASELLQKIWLLLRSLPWKSSDGRGYSWESCSTLAGVHWSPWLFKRPYKRAPNTFESIILFWKPISNLVYHDEKWYSIWQRSVWLLQELKTIWICEYTLNADLKSISISIYAESDENSEYWVEEVGYVSRVSELYGRRRRIIFLWFSSARDNLKTWKDTWVGQGVGNPYDGADYTDFDWTSLTGVIDKCRNVDWSWNIFFKWGHISCGSGKALPHFG